MDTRVVVRVVEGPVRSEGGSIWRLVELSDGSARLEKFGPNGWVPTKGVSIGVLEGADPLTPEEIARLGCG